MKINCLVVYIFLSLIFSSNAVFAANSQAYKVARAAKRAAINSSAHTINVCDRISSNFRRDVSFSRSIYKYCVNNDQALLSFKQAIFPMANNHYKNYKEVYPYNYAEFAVAFNKMQIESLKNIVNNYCKYNSYRVRLKDPNVCSQERLKYIFSE